MFLKKLIYNTQSATSVGTTLLQLNETQKNIVTSTEKKVRHHLHSLKKLKSLLHTLKSDHKFTNSRNPLHLTVLELHCAASVS